MVIECREEKACLHAAIRGELDHHHARQVMEQLDRQIDLVLPRSLVLELEGLAFTDSSGIAVLIRAFRRMGQLGGSVTVRGTPEQARKVFYAAGLQKLMRFE